MIPAWLAHIGPFFREGERYLNGTPINWAEMHEPTMRAVYRLRVVLDTPVTLIRGPHPDADGTKPFKRTAVDLCVPGVDLGQVAMALFRFQHISYGLYSGNSVHIDSRPFSVEPARWMAVKSEEAHYLQAQNLLPLITGRADGWLYLSWAHARSFEALSLVLALARKRMQEQPDRAEV